MRLGDAVTVCAKEAGRGADRAEIDARTVGRDDLSRRELVADEQLIGDRLHFAGVEKDVRAPPLLEFEITRRLGVDLGVEIVVLAPKGIGRIEILEIANEPRS